MANKERLEREFTELGAMIHQKGDISEIKLTELVAQALILGWSAVVHNMELPEGDYPELRVNYEDYAF